MSRHQRKRKSARQKSAGTATPAGTVQDSQRYKTACRLAVAGEHEEARRLYADLEAAIEDPKLRAVVRNDLAVLDAMAEDFEAARRGLDAALVLDAACDPARLNLPCLLCPIPVVGDGRTKIAARKEPGGPFHGCGRRREYQRCARRTRSVPARSAEPI